MKSLKVALPGYNVLTETNPDHFALRSDEDWVLIKEFTRGNITVGSHTTGSVNHNLGYVPFAASWFLQGGVYRWCNDSAFIRVTMHPTTTTLEFRNDYGSNTIFYYYIFYDKQV